MVVEDIENILYEVLSRGENRPEKSPRPGGIFDLSVRKKYASDEKPPLETAHITARDVYVFGQVSHCEVEGLGRVGEVEVLPCTATFEIGKKYPAKTLIGELFFQRMVFVNLNS